MELRDEVEDRFGARRRGLGVRGRAMDKPAPAVDRGVDLVAAAREQQGLAAARAKADRADLAVCTRQGAQMGRRRFEVLHRLGIRFSEHDRHHRRHVVRVGRPAGAGIEVGGERIVADIGKAPGDVADVLDEAKGFVDDDDAGVTAGLARPREIACDRVAAAFELEVFAAHAAGVGYRTGYVRHAEPPWETRPAG